MYFVKYANTKTWATKQTREVIHSSKEFTTIFLWIVTLRDSKADVIYKTREQSFQEQRLFVRGKDIRNIDSQDRSPKSLMWWAWRWLGSRVV